MSPKYVDKKQRTDDIIWAALEVFSQKGYGAASVDQIAAASDLSKGTLYEYFPSKEELYVAAIMAFSETYDASMRSRLDPVEDPFLRLLNFIGFSLEFICQDDSPTVRIMLDILQQTVLDDGVFSNRKDLIREMMQGGRKMLTGLLLDGVAREIFKPAIATDVETLATNMLAFIDGAGLHFSMTGHYFNLQEQITHWMRLLADHILIDPDAYDIDELIAQIIWR